MAHATAVSDLERAEHLNYADGKGVKRVTAYNDGVQVNVATEDNQGIEIVTLQDLDNKLSFLLDRLEYGAITDNSKKLKVNLIDSGALVGVTTVTTVASVTNTVRQGDLQVQRVNEALLDTAFINGITNNVTF